MIGPVSGTGRTMMASLQQAMEKGMPPDQAIQYVKSMATQGVAPLADLYAMMNQFQRLKQQQVKPPQTPPTIRDQLNIMDQQQQMQPQQDTSARAGGVGGLGGPTSYADANYAGQPMDRGLGAIDAGLMEYPQFNGGGIVAMASGALADSEEPGFFERSGLPFLTTKRGLAANEKALDEFFTLRRSGGSVVLEAQKLAKEGKIDEALELLRSENIDPSQAFGEELPASSRAATETAPAPPQAAPPSPVPSAANPFAGTGGVGFDINLGGARTDAFGRPIAQDQAIVPAPARDVTAAAPTGGRAAPATTGLRRMTEEKPKETSSYLQELKDLRESEGLGKARAERMTYLTNEEKNLAKEFGSDKMLAFAEAGFRMAGAASRPGATFLGALAEGAMSGTQALRALNKEYRLNKRTINDAMYQMREADEAEKEGDIKTALNMRENAKTRLLEAEKFNMNLENDIMVMNMRLSGAERVATIQSGGRGSTAGFRQTQLQLQALQNSKSQADRVFLTTRLTDPNTAKQARQESERLQQQINELLGLSGVATGSMSAVPTTGMTGNVIDYSALE